ncbi:L,D-transpeptidase family protein [Geminicoccus harenae]|uniref:L,D-transpeptidase family protein n=2 Tax=Geminicoccus harenae TaxID=2498453 RepID=UPI001C946F4B|nr:L,D-transpeptidase family protein [Geminicoccus harenae]
MGSGRVGRYASRWRAAAALAVGLLWLLPASAVAHPIERAIAGPPVGSVAAIAPPGAVDPAVRLLRATLAAAESGAGDPSLRPLLPFYRARGELLAFTGDPDGTARGSTILATLQRADLEGLEPAAYEVELLSALLPAAEAGEPAARVEFELRLARALVRYALDVSAGRVGPEQEQDGDPRPADAALPARLLAQAAQADDLPGWLASLPPQGPPYARLRSALAEWRAKLDWPAWTRVPDGRRLTVGLAGPEVVALRLRLVEEGLLAPPAVPGQLSALFDRDLLGPVRAFQARYGLDPDGVVGERTLRALNASVADRVDQIRVNMERRRWLPRELGRRYVFVNLADFTLKVVADERTVHASRVVVGAPFTATPAMSHRISHLVLNPYWSVPRSIMVREMLPELQRDPGWLARERLRLFADATPGAMEVDPHGIDWSGVTARNWRWRIRQDAGPGNALGVIKFLFPNKDDVYLHDTPSKHLFQRSVRAFSHGCIRVEDPLALADVLARDQDWPRPRLEAAIANGRPEQFVRLAEPVPIHLAYLTAWVGKDGRLVLLDDVYGRDRRLRAALGLRGS